ncbi:MAG TPA: hypothetical protein VIC25_06150 [Caulobacteraceae bacterium]|jgi:hypothetical protein
MRRRWASLIAASLLGLSGCATTQRLSAAADVHALMIAIRDDDKPAFDAHVDRPALEAQVQAMIVARAAAPGSPAWLRDAGLLLSGPLARGAGRLLIQPEVFRAVADHYGYRPSTPIPGVFAIASQLRPLRDGAVCAVTRRDGPCLVTFADEDGTWRLVAFDGDAAMLKLR